MGLIKRKEEGPREANYARSLKHRHNKTAKKKKNWLARQILAEMWIREFYL